MSDVWKQRQVSILSSQVGYHPAGQKRVVFRSALEKPARDPDGARFAVVVESGKEVHTGTIRRWGPKWGSHWWVADFTELERPGTYRVVVPDLADAHGEFAGDLFDIDRNVMRRDLVTIAMDQLDARVEDTPEEPGRPALKTWRDCASDWICEMGSMSITLHALADVHDFALDRLSPADRKRLKDQMGFGLNYVFNSRRRTTNPLTDGFLEHDLQARMRAPKTTKKLFFRNWHDQAYAITALTRVFKIIRDHDPQKAAECLATAENLYQTCVRRPYHLETDFVANDIGWDGLEQFPPVIPEHRQYIERLGRFYYGKPATWKFPSQLRTKDKLAFLWACTLLHQITDKKEYLDKAVEFADMAAERQFLDWEAPIEGTFGNFYEWDGDDAFMLEYNHSHGWFMGNIEPTNLRGFMDLLRQLPDHPSAARWRNVIVTYAEHFARKSAELSPFGIYPVAVYRDPQYGGVKFFQVILHGGTCLYGQIAKNLLEIGDFLGDSSFHALAEANLQFVVGLNPGFPNAYEETAWQPTSLLWGIGRRSFEGSARTTHPVSAAGTEHKLGPAGSGYNGFSSFGQFSEHSLADGPDTPKGILNPENKLYFNEDYLPHSHGYVSGIARLETPFTLKVIATDNGKPVQAKVEVCLKERRNFTTGLSGELTVSDLPLPARGTVSASYDGRTISRPIETLGGGELIWRVDFADCLEGTLTAPERLARGTSAKGRLVLVNRGSASVRAAIHLAADGVEVSPAEWHADVAPGRTVTVDIKLAAGKKVMPYLVLACRVDRPELLAVGRGYVAQAAG